MASFQPQKINKHAVVDLDSVDTFEEAVHVIEISDPAFGRDGDGAAIGWIAARSAQMTVHSRKDGRFRIIERP